MAHHDYDIANGSGATVRADLNNVLEAIATLNSGTSAPSTTFANMLWYDTTNSLLKKRNNANTTWETLDVTLGLVIGTNVQAYDADLAAIAALVSAADKLPYATGAGTWALADFTTFGRSLVDDADASAARTTLGLVIGTNVQAYDAELAAIAGLTSAADRLPYFTGSGTAALATFTSFGRSLVDDADASAARTTLGLVIGTNVQAYDAELAAIAGLVSAADSAPYFTGSGTAALMTVTSFARTLLDDTTQAAARTTLGLTPGTDVQAYDAELAAIAGLVSAADRLPYFTGSGTAALATFTAAGRALVDDADAAAQRTTLGLVIGTNVQAYDAELAAIAGLTSAADSAPYFTGSGTAALMTVTSAARSVLDDTTVAAMRTTLGAAPLDAPSFTTSVTLPGDPASALQAATKQYVDNAILGVNKRTTVRVATTANITISTALNNADTLDGVTLATGDYVLVKDQSAPAENGVYVVGPSPARATEFDTYNEHVGSLIAVQEGTTNADTIWLGTSNAGGTLDTTAIAFSKLQVTALADGDKGDVTVSSTGSVWTIDNGVVTLAKMADMATASLIGRNTAGTGAPEVLSAATVRTLLGLVIGTNVQAYDAELAALAGLTSAADALPYFTGSGTASTTTLTSFARTLLDDTTQAAARTTLGLTPGTDVQAYSANLLAIAGLAVTDGNVIVGNGSTWVAESGATARTSLGLGTGDSPQFTGINVGAASDTTVTRSAAGVIAVEGVDVLTTATGLGQGKHTIPVPALAMSAQTTSPAAEGNLETTTNDIMAFSWDFDATADENIQFAIPWPKSSNEGTITFQYQWSHGSTATNFGVAFFLQALGRGDGDALDTAMGTAVGQTDTGGSTDTVYTSAESSAVTIGGSFAEGDLVFFRLYRDVSDAGDTLAVDARIHALKVFVTLNAQNDA